MKKLVLFAVLMSSLFGITIDELKNICKNPNAQSKCFDEDSSIIEAGTGKYFYNAFSKQDIEHFKNLCLKQNISMACFVTMRTIAFNKDRGSIKDYEKTFYDVLYKMCDLKEVKTSNKDSNTYLFCDIPAGYALRQNQTKKAMNYYKKACDGGQHKSCIEYFKIANAPKIKELKAKAAEFERKANAARNSAAYYDLKQKADFYSERALLLETAGVDGAEYIVDRLNNALGTDFELE